MPAPGNPHLLVPWKPGQSGNPGGLSKIRREYSRAIEESQSPANVAEVVEYARQMALAGDVPAMRVYLEAVKVLGKGVDSEAQVKAAHALVRAMLEEKKQQLQAAIDVETKP